MTADNVAGTVRMTLEPSTIGGLAIDRAAVDADYTAMTGEIRQLDIIGRDINVNASGTLALNESGQSNLTLHADTPQPRGTGQAGSACRSPGSPRWTRR